MEIESIDKIIANLLRIYETRDPFKLAKEKNVIVIEKDLGDIYGFYTRLRNVKVIYINSKLSWQDKILACAHELGHSVLHPAANTPHLSAASITSELKIEKEANYFATRLIVDGSHDDHGINNTYSILNYYGLPIEFERFLKKS
ncbi:ImmA/IrrE family metallo-endopeptidase [Candidatus Enterococcus clewellii]|uniref:IrrE N-terminal-like domain-containing protein n=1 Tax=Candidatus Enterococcus clewellii TaxID=1834193 RepID=A0A242K7X8_9ENTE|nr:ImmA/IrrE family metallo-endopeptidase [Enterococcus sp. 9E7_DIV0242]OTP17252.1 hypothetical protein A5888_001390 [Enterococcus sp. 9E7_DIV0242]